MLLSPFEVIYSPFQRLLMTSISQSLLPEFDHEIANTRKTLDYLRMNDVAVPSIYGPSADEGGM